MLLISWQILVKLPKLNQIIQHKRQLAALYDRLLPDWIKKPLNKENVYHIYPIQTSDRDALRTYLQEQGVGTEVHYPIAPCDQEALAAEGCSACSVAQQLSRELLSLPISVVHTEADIIQTCDLIEKFKDYPKPSGFRVGAEPRATEVYQYVHEDCAEGEGNTTEKLREQGT